MPIQAHIECARSQGWNGHDQVSFHLILPESRLAVTPQIPTFTFCFMSCSASLYLQLEALNSDLLPSQNNA
jgi:hypothetical protein